ncbi:hypothetical protein [Rhizobium sp. Leaf383]|uniref:hypothetical protein n=1 Tax=Rhizobium sp. Leaf383 TaxID=1736357 RepID=UPI0007136227|nr:hypothetical protein [Rhizobium sp. Leaf383]KQS84270.1 hypothetical protein ASG58_21100 [Rhizobium sp. Leaf383]
MQPKYFPNITEDQILLMNRVTRSIAENPEYLNDPKCPYTQTVKDYFTQQVAQTSAVPDLFEGDDVVAIERQIQKLINDLEVYGQSLGAGDASEKLQYFKTKNSLIEKLLSNMERVTNLKLINEFRSVVIQFMDEILTPDQITIFMQRIDGVLINGK